MMKLYGDGLKKANQKNRRRNFLFVVKDLFGGISGSNEGAKCGLIDSMNAILAALFKSKFAPFPYQKYCRVYIPVIEVYDRLETIK